MKRATTMNTPATTFSSDDYKADPVPSGLMALMGRRACNNFYDFVVSRFLDSGIKKSELARRSGRSPALINRWLASPHNWTLETAGILLFAISGEEFVLNGQKPFERPVTNFNPLRDTPKAENRPRTMTPVAQAAE